MLLQVMASCHVGRLLACCSTLYRVKTIFALSPRSACALELIIKKIVNITFYYYLLRSCLVHQNSITFQNFSSHQILWHIHKAINIDKNQN